MSSNRTAEMEQRGSRGENSRFWLTLVKVILVQGATLLLLWALQARYTP